MSESRTPMTDSTIVRSKIHGVELEAVPVGFARRLELALAQAERCLQVSALTLPHIDGRSAHSLLQATNATLATIKELRDGK